MAINDIKPVAGNQAEEAIDQQREAEKPDSEAQYPDDGDQADAPETQADAEVEVSVEVSIDGEPVAGEPVAGEDDQDDHRAPGWVKTVRQDNRRLARELKELKAKLAAAPAAKVDDAPEPGPKPKLEDFGYDSEAFEPALEKWMTTKAKAEQRKAEKQRDAEAQAQAWNNRLSEYETGKKRLKLPDFDDAEEVLKDALNQTQQGIIVHGAKDPALFVYATGKSHKALAELAAEKDPVKFAILLGKIEERIKMATKKPAPQPERKLNTAGGGTPKSSQATLDKLRADAEKTGDRTAVVRYLKQQAQKKA